MTPRQETAVQMCVTQQKGTSNVKKKTTELLYIQNKVFYVI